MQAGRQQKKRYNTATACSTQVKYKDKVQAQHAAARPEVHRYSTVHAVDLFFNFALSTMRVKKMEHLRLFDVFGPTP